MTFSSNPLSSSDSPSGCPVLSPPCGGASPVCGCSFLVLGCAPSSIPDVLGGGKVSSVRDVSPVGSTLGGSNVTSSVCDCSSSLLGGEPEDSVLSKTKEGSALGGGASSLVASLSEKVLDGSALGGASDVGSPCRPLCACPTSSRACGAGSSALGGGGTISYILDVLGVVVSSERPPPEADSSEGGCCAPEAS